MANTARKARATLAHCRARARLCASPLRMSDSDAASSAAAPAAPLGAGDTLTLLVATDLHLGFAERDPVRGLDSFLAFEEVLATARSRGADAVLLAGDIFHENKPSRMTMFKTIQARLTALRGARLASVCAAPLHRLCSAPGRRSCGGTCSATRRCACRCCPTRRRTGATASRAAARCSTA